MTNSSIILGIDPGYDRVGWAVGNLNKKPISVLNFGCIQSDSKNSLVARYSYIDTELTKIVNKYNPNQLAIETLFFSKNTKTAMKVSEARGVILSCCLRHGLTINEYNPGSIKLAVTGSGRANKKAIEKMISLQLKVNTSQMLDDAIDALAILLTHAVSQPKLARSNK